MLDLLTIQSRLKTHIAAAGGGWQQQLSWAYRCAMMSRNEGVWLSNGWVKTLLWIFLPCFLYTIISIVYFVASYIDK